MPEVPEPEVRATRYEVSVLPEEYSDCDLYTIVVEYYGDGRWAVRNRIRTLAADGTWSGAFRWSGGNREPATSAECESFDTEHAAWLASRRFDEETALRLAKEAAPRVSYRGLSAQEVLAQWRAGFRV